MRRLPVELEALLADEPKLLLSAAGAFIIRTGFGGVIYKNYNKEPLPKKYR